MNESSKSNEDQINKLISIQSENDGNIIKQADMKKIKERKERKKSQK